MPGAMVIWNIKPSKNAENYESVHPLYPLYYSLVSIAGYGFKTLNSFTLLLTNQPNISFGYQKYSALRKCMLLSSALFCTNSSHVFRWRTGRFSEIPTFLSLLQTKLPAGAETSCENALSLPSCKLDPIGERPDDS